MSHETTTQGNAGRFYGEHIDRIKALDPGTWETLVRAFQNRLRADILISLRRRDLPDGLADDVEQETWIIALRKIGEFVWEDEDRFYHWLRAISYNCIHEMNRSISRVVPVSEIDDSSDPDRFLDEFSVQDDGLEDMLVLRQRMLALDHALRVLKPQEREIFLLWCMGEKPRNLAVMYGKNPRSLSQLLSRAKQKVLSSLGRTDD